LQGRFFDKQANSRSTAYVDKPVGDIRAAGTKAAITPLTDF
jgi:hypothetical protein